VGGPREARGARAHPRGLLNPSESGAALLEIVVGTAVGLVVFGFLVALLHVMVVAAASRHSVMMARTQASQLLERMRSEAASAWSIFVPATDVTGQSNSDGHEVDFTTEDSRRAIYHWCYLYDAHAQTLTKYGVVPGASPQPGETLTAVTSFSARAYPASDVARTSSTIYDPLFGGESVTSVSYTLSDGSAAGNGFVLVSLAAADTSLHELLSTTVAPTQLTIVVQYTPPPQ
jgi:hypothetical protein